MDEIKSKIMNEIYEFRGSKITGQVIAGRERNVKVLGEYEKVFNGIALDISKEEAEKIKKVKGVKKVYPNYEVHATLMDSVPLINADDVWQIPDMHGRTITGKNTTGDYGNRRRIAGAVA